MTSVSLALPGKHDSLREGATLGLLVASGTWTWLALVDVAAGEPLRTFAVLGGIAFFTAMHYLLNLVYGVAIVSGIHGAIRQPGLIMAVTLGVLEVEFGFALLSAVFSNLGLGGLAWARIFGGSLIGLVIAIMFLSRRHPLVAQLRRAAKDDL
jgi:hypothetical protein